MRIIILIKIPMWLFPHNSGSEQLRFGASDSNEPLEMPIEQFLSLIRLEKKDKITEMIAGFQIKDQRNTCV